MTTHILHVSGAPFKHFYLLDLQFTPVDNILYVVKFSRVPDTSKGILPGGDDEKSLGSELH